MCEQGLKWLDMSVNAKKSSCLRIGARFNANRCKIVNSEGRELLWVNPHIAMNFLHTYVAIRGGGKLPPRCISGFVPPRDKIPKATPMLWNEGFQWLTR